MILTATIKNTGKGDVSFDNFVQACVTMKTLTDSFRQFDNDQDGWIQINYEQVSIHLSSVCVKSRTDIYTNSLLFLVLGSCCSSTRLKKNKRKTFKKIKPYPLFFMYNTVKPIQELSM